MSSTSLREDDDPWSKLVVLTLDGSAYHVLFTLLVLKALMEQIQTIEKTAHSPKASSSADSPLIDAASIDEGFKKIEENWPKFFKAKHPQRASRYLPCHYFDYIGSTSTGGLAALLLGTFRMTAEGAVDSYERFLPLIYEAYRPSRMGQVKALLELESTKKKQAPKLDRFLEDLGHQSFQSDKLRCKTVVTAFAKRYESAADFDIAPFLFRSYHSEAGAPVLTDASKITVSEITRATACNPFRLEWVSIGDHPFCDVGFRLSNPTSIIVDDIRLKGDTMDDSAGKEIGILLSIGIQSADTKPSSHSEIRKYFMRSNQRLNRTLRDTANEVHDSMLRLSTKLEELQYHRLGCKLDLSRMPEELSGVRKTEKLRNAIEKATQDFLEDLVTKAELEECAHKLVSLRRRRCRRRNWERFAFGWQYKCRICSGKETAVFQSKADLVHHLFVNHDVAPDAADGEEIKKLVEQGRSNSD